MEGNKTRKLPLILVLAMVVVCSVVFTVLCATGIMPIITKNGEIINIKTASLVKNAATVSDEETLRELLLLKKDLAIIVAEDIVIDEAFIVRGNKTLYGNTTVSADVAGTFTQSYIFDVQTGASLTIDGLVLDGNGMADGIMVNQKAKLNYLSGTIQYMRYGIYANGTVTLKDVQMQHMSTAGIMAAFRSEVFVKGGTYFNSNTNMFYVNDNGYMEIHEGTDISVTRGDAIYNYGTLNVYGGTIHDTVGRVINNYGTLYMDYQGSKKDGYIEMYDIGTIIVRSESSYDSYISDIHAVNIGTNGVYTTDLVTNGKTTVERCIFDTPAIVEGNGMSVSRKVEIRDVTILNSQGGGLNLRANSDVIIDGLVIDGTNGNCISVYGELDANDIHLSNVKKNNMVVYGEAEVSVSDSVFGKSKRTSIYLNPNGRLTLDDVEVQGVIDENLYCFHVSEGAEVTMEGDTMITGATRSAFGLYKNSILNMESGTICNINGTGQGAGVYMAQEGATFNMSGGSITGNSTIVSSGAVFVCYGATFNMLGGTISNNYAKLSGGAIQVQGVMNFVDGIISDNSCETNGGAINVGNNTGKKIYGTLNMTGGTITGNVAAGSGGGINISGKTTANISGGTITGNSAKGLGDGIHDNGYLIVSGSLYMGQDEIELNNKNTILVIKGDNLSRHNATTPLLVIPNKSLYNGDTIIECDSPAAAASLMTHVKAGTNAFAIALAGNNMIVEVQLADMDITNAETVYVSNFQEFKEAVETTEGSRIVILKADIVMESTVAVPVGRVVVVRDDGTQRTLSRKEGVTSAFLQTGYGTGLILEATKTGNLVLDGQAFGAIDETKIAGLLKLYGTTEITGVAFKNNGTAESTMNGAFVSHESGQLTIINAVFENGSAGRGGAVYVSKTEAIIKDSAFKNNAASGNGGAIYNASNSVLTLEGTKTTAVFEGNVSGGNGGAIGIGTGSMEIAGYTFIGNSAVNGGAIRLNSEDIEAYVTSCVFKSNAASYEGGAISTFTKNAAGLCITDSYFGGEAEADGNTAVMNGGAIYANSTKTNIKNTAFAKNAANANGGAIYNASNAALIVKGTDDASFFEGNIAKGTSTNSDIKIYGGGAICVGSGTFTLEGYTIKDNTAENMIGGAIHFNSGNTVATIKDAVFSGNRTVDTDTTDSTVYGGGAISSKAKDVTIENTTFTLNAAAGDGGAILSHGVTLTIKESDFGGENLGNTAAVSGGAIYNGSGCAVTITSTGNSVFNENKSNGGLGGGAICIGTGNLTIEGYTFTGNAAENGKGGAIELNSTNTLAAITGSVFDANATSGTYHGGAIYSKAKELNITETDFTNNYADGGNGGAIYGEAGAVSLVSTNADSVFSANTGKTDLTGIYNPDNSADYEKYGGGAIYIAVGSLDVTGYTFSDNAATEGGAIKTRQAGITTTITNSAFLGNEATYRYGGAICNYGTESITLTDCRFGGEEGAGNVAAGNGGAIYHAKGGAVILTDNNNESFPAVFLNNQSKGNGGAITIGSGSLTVTGYEFVGNTGTNGGAVRLNASGIVATFEDSIFKSNTASTHGGAINNASTTKNDISLSFNKCTFENNAATSNGGAVYTEAAAKVSITSSTFGKLSDDTANEPYKYGNTAKFGGAVYVKDVAALTEVSDSTFIGNQATVNNGGAIYSNKGSTLTIDNSDFTYNYAKNAGGAVQGEGAAVTISGDSDFKYNTALTYGGAIRAAGSSHVTLDGTGSFVGNTTDGIGGAISNGASGSLTVSGYVFEDNRALNGGAIHILSGAKASVSAATFMDNESTEYGGAIYTSVNGIIIADTNFISNHAAGGKGGAIYSEDGGVILTKSAGFMPSFIENTAENFTSDVEAYGGGAIYIAAGTLDVTGYAFSSNGATEGGAIKTKQAAITTAVTNCTFSENKATQAQGGAICNYGTVEITITDSSFSENTAKNGGAVYHAKGGKITLNDNNTSMRAVFENNTATYNGGAICIGSGTVDINGYEFIENNGEYGGAVRFNRAGIVATIDDAVFEKNQATKSGGAISNASNKTYTDASKAAVTITNTTFGGEDVGNTAAENGGAILSENSKIKFVGDSISALFEGNTAGNDNMGGAIYAGSGGVDVNGYTFTGNSAKQGGAIYALSDLEVTDSAFKSNHTTSTTKDGYNGGAIYYVNVTVTITDTSFTENSAYNGGAFCNATGGTLILKADDNADNAFFKDNYSTWNGGAIRANAGTFTITGYTFEENASANRYGGAIYVDGARTAVTADECKFTGNSATSGGAIFKIGEGSLKLTGNGTDGSKAVFEGNYLNKTETDTSLYYALGGAIYHSNGTLEVSGYTFDGNGAVSDEAVTRGSVRGGAVYVEDRAGKAVFTDSVFTGNAASESGGAIYYDAAADTKTRTITGCTFGGENAGNTAVTGGAIYTTATALSITDTSYIGNTAPTYGGGIYVASGDLDADGTVDADVMVNVDGCTFKSNVANFGGAIYNYAETNVTDSAFEYNKTSKKGNDYGGAIYNISGTLNVTDTSFSYNEAQNGGAIGNYKGTVKMITDDNALNAVLTGNKATNQGGAIRQTNGASKFEVTGYTFTSNSATGNGGAFQADGASKATLTDCKFASNTSGGNGGAVQNGGNASTTIVGVDGSANSMFYGNSAVNGGAVHISSGSLTISDYAFDTNSATNGGAIYGTAAINATNSTFTSNAADTNGGAIYAGDAMTVTGSEFDGNTAYDGAGIYLGTTATDKTLKITGSTFTNNAAGNWGGAINNSAKSKLVITSCEFGKTSEDVTNAPYKYGNTAKYGGAIFANQNISAQIEISDSKFTGNQATTKHGGGIFMWTSSKLTVSNTDFAYNSAKEYGGAIEAEGSSVVTITGGTFSYNSGNYGGAIYGIANSSITILDGTVFASNKTTGNHGGAIYHKGALVVENADFNMNIAKGHGGAICSEGGSLKATDCDFTNNEAGNQGGAYRIAAGTNATLENGTFSGNSAAKGGGAIQFNTGKVTITNYVFTGNTVNGSSNSINTNNCTTSNYVTLTNCTIEASDVSGKGVNP